MLKLKMQNIKIENTNLKLPDALHRSRAQGCGLGFRVTDFRFWFCAFCFSIFVCFGLSAVIWAVRNPLGPPTIPPSSTGGGLVRSPNPIDTSSNLVVTGNVSAGRSFRGIVPYRGTSDFAASLGSSSFDAFLRDSAGSESFGRYTGRSIPYYSSTRTVTTTRPGRGGVFRPTAAGVGGRAGGDTGLSALSRRQQLSDWRGQVPYLGSRPSQTQKRGLRLGRPMTMTQQELEEVISSQIARYPQGRDLTGRQRQAQIEQFRHDLRQVREKTDELKKSVLGIDEFLKPATKTKLTDSVLKSQLDEKLRMLPESTKEPKQPDTSSDKQYLEPQPDVFEQMKLQIDSSQKPLEQLPSKEPSKEITESKEKPDEESSQKKTSVLDEFTDIALAARAQSVLGQHKTFASFSKDRFNQHMKTAEEYLKAGRYYRAADVYSMASIYKPSDPLPYAGKSHALFAAGEYMSSAHFLSRALEIFPQYARFKIDLVGMVGDRDKLESRVVDVEQWHKYSGAAELQFLLGYIYYQMGRLDKAKEAIDAAYEKMPESPAIIALKKAIDDVVK